MSEWTELVKERLGPLGFAPEREQEIVAELAAHLEEIYEDFRRCRCTEEQSRNLTIATVSDWAEVRSQICFANMKEGSMNQRSKTVWLPGLVILTGSMVLLRFLINAGVQPLTFFTEWHHPLQFYIPWLLTLPLFGAVGAYWSRRHGGRTKARLLAGMLPALCMLGFGFVALVAGLIVDVGGGRHSIWHLLCGFGWYLLCWTLAPGLGLMLGTLPLLRGRSGTTTDGTSRVVSQKGENSSPANHLMLFLGLARRSDTARA